MNFHLDTNMNSQLNCLNSIVECIRRRADMDSLSTGLLYVEMLLILILKKEKENKDKIQISQSTPEAMAGLHSQTYESVEFETHVPLRRHGYDSHGSIYDLLHILQ